MALVQQFVNQGNVHFSDNISSRVQVGNSFGSHIFFDQPVLGEPVLDEPATFDAADLHNEPAVAADAPAAEETPAVVETASVIPAVETTEPLPIRIATPATASPEETTLTKQGVQGLPGPPGHPGHVTLANIVKIQTIEGTFPLRALAPVLRMICLLTSTSSSRMNYQVSFSRSNLGRSQHFMERIPVRCATTLIVILSIISLKSLTGCGS